MTSGVKILWLGVVIVGGLFLMAVIVRIASYTTSHTGEPSVAVPTPSETGAPKVRRPPVPRVLQLAAALDELSVALVSGADAVEQDLLDGNQGESGEKAVKMATGWRKLAKEESDIAESIRRNPEAAARDEMWAGTRQAWLTLYSSTSNAASRYGIPARTKTALEDVTKHVRVIIDLTKPGQSW